MPRLCRCGAIVDKRCPTCQPSSSASQGTACSRGYDRQWRGLRASYLAEYPLCQDCEHRGTVTAASEVHHVVPISVDKTRRLDWSNLRSLCGACHVEQHRGTHLPGGM